MGNCAESPSTEAKLVATTEVCTVDGESPVVEPSPSIITIKFEKDPSDKLGCDIKHSADRTCLQVKIIREGLFERWNKANPDSVVEIGDWLMEINGVKGNSVKMLKQIAGASSVEFVVLKPVPP